MTISMPKQYTLPVLSLNGSSPDSLKEQWTTALRSARRAIHDAHAAIYRPRDFQTLDEWRKHKEEMDQILAYVEDLVDMCEQQLTSIADQRR
jgi:hypothetical protein